MWQQFLLKDLHFGLNLYTALAFFTVFWLYLDAYSLKKSSKNVLRFSGFLMLSVAYLIHATNLGSGYSQTISLVLKFAGYLLIILSLIIDPLIPKPDSKAGVAVLAGVPVGVWFNFINPILAMISGWLFLRRATIGLEYHLRRLAGAMILVAIGETMSILGLFSISSNVEIFNLTKPFGIVWMGEHLIQIIATVIILRWTFSYLLKQINTQLFIVFTTTILSIFLVTTISFSLLLVKNLSDDTLTRLQTDVSVMSYAIEAKQAETEAWASILSQDREMIDLMAENNRKLMSAKAENLLISKKLNSVVIVNENGQIVARGEDYDRIGESLSDDLVVKRALKGESVSSILSQDGAMYPSVLVRSAVPVIKEEKVIGVVITANTLDNIFLDEVKKKTGLEAGIFGGRYLSATTIKTLTADTRPLGTKISEEKIISQVLAKGESHSDLVSFLNVPYFAAYYPLKDLDNSVIGMIFVGRMANSVFEVMNRAMEMTFVLTAVLILLSIIPVYLISRYIFNQLK